MSERCINCDRKVGGFYSGKFCCRGCRDDYHEKEVEFVEKITMTKTAEKNMKSWMEDYKECDNCRGVGYSYDVDDKCPKCKGFGRVSKMPEEKYEEYKDEHDFDFIKELKAL